MRLSIRKRFLTLAVLGTALVSPLVLAHFDDKQPYQSYRQSWFTLLAMNFGPLNAMVEGDMPWNDGQVQGFARELEAVTSLDLLRGFADGSDKGTTRAKPGIWENRDDFAGKLDDLRTAAAALNSAAASGGRALVSERVGAVGKACKACHDEYKSKDYLY